MSSVYVETLADCGVTRDLSNVEFLAAMERYKEADPGMAAVLVAVKAGVGKLRERPQGMSYKRGEQWAALERPTWRPDIRAAVTSRGERQLPLTCNEPFSSCGV
ncbi:hypothetical protein [Streptomyces liangshanensis]|uniref:hypothetical protein n=1 Tax=Streptomyces liangshanensis TaxID=2717324 RepID=UPI0036DF65FF